MNALLNIASGETSFLINPATVTALYYFGHDDAIVIYTTEGQMQPLGAKGWGLDIADIAQKLSDSGYPLISSPRRHEGKEYPSFINPAAITFITTAQEKNSSAMGLILGVKGLGRHEVYGAKPEEVDALITAATADRKFLKYTPDVAHARWYQAKELYIDPIAVTQIRNGYGEQVDLDFEACGGRLDVQIWSKNRFSHPMPQVSGDFTGKEIMEVFRTVEKVWEKELEDARIKTQELAQSVINDIATANPALVRVPSDEGHFYVTPDRISHVFTSPGKPGEQPHLTIYEKKAPLQEHPGPLTIRFNTAADRDAALQAVIKSVPNKTNPPRP